MAQPSVQSEARPAVDEGPPRRDGAAQRAARRTGRSIGRSPFASDEGDVVVGSGPEAQLPGPPAAAAGHPRRRAADRGFAVVPVARRAVPAGAAAVRGRPRARERWPAPSLLSAIVRRTAPAGPAARGRRVRARHGARGGGADAIRPGRVPRRRAQGDRRARARRRPAHRFPRSTRAAGHAGRPDDDHRDRGKRRRPRRSCASAARWSARRSPLAAAAISVEMFVWSERHGDAPLARAFRWPGIEIQRIVATREPTEPQLNVAESAMHEILRLETT